MADVEKAEKLAAARKKLEEFKKSKRKPENHHRFQSNDYSNLSQNFPCANTTVPLNKTNENNGSELFPSVFNTQQASQLPIVSPGNLQTQEMGVTVLVQSSETSGSVTNNQLIVNSPDSGQDMAFTPHMFNANAFLDTSKPAWDPNEWLQPKSSEELRNTDPVSSEIANHQQTENEFVRTLPQTNHLSTELPSMQQFHNGESELSNQMSEHISIPIPAAPSSEHVKKNLVTENIQQSFLSDRPSSESLRILAEQMTELCDDNNSPNGNSQKPSSPLAALEARIQDLNAQLAAERSNNQQLQIYLKESQARCVQLETKVGELQTESELTLAQRIGPLQEQLRAHAQTVGILVGEKTELEAALAHHISRDEQRTGEMEELQNRLRASRHKVNELEKELSHTSSKVQANERQLQTLTQEVDRLKRENGVLSKQLEDVKEEASELRQKLNAKVNEVMALENSLEEQQKQLSLAQLRVTQLSGVESPMMTSELEALHQHKFSLEKRCSELTETLRVMGAERDQAAEQYQQYVTQLNTQVQSLNQKMDQLVMENGNLRKREQELVHSMSELERKLQQNKKVHLEENELSSQPAVDSPDNSDLIARIEALELENAQFLKTVEAKDQALSELQSEIEEYKVQISDLEAVKGDQPDQARLLAAMESDKVAAAQATAQNAKLKDQVQELQEAFIKISNDKLQLTEDLENEKRVNSNMGEKIACLAEELHELRLLVAQRDRELKEHREDHGHSHDHDHARDHERNHEHCDTKSREHTSDSHNHAHEHRSNHGHHDNDHDHHHHPHDHDDGNDHFHTHENEKQYSEIGSDNEPQRPISDITDATGNTNTNIRCLIPQKSTESHESGSSSSVTEGATTDDGANDVTGRGCIAAHGMHTSYLSLQRAMEQLQARFTRTMTEYAELSDEKQKLEHLVMQLQGETETIGEYVALYQIQRAALQQRARDKDHQLACLAEEREALRKKLADLSDLVCRLVAERNLAKAASNNDSMNPNDWQNQAVVSQDEQTTDNVLATNQRSQVDPTDSSNTAGQILALLNEIGTSSLVDNKMPENFHPCPWCSGRLITV